MFYINMFLAQKDEINILLNIRVIQISFNTLNVAECCISILSGYPVHNNAYNYT